MMGTVREWKAFGRVNLVDDEMMKAMADSGCLELRFGIESGSDRVLTLIRKGFTAAQSLEAETHKELLVTDTYAPDFNLHDFRDDVTNEVSGTGYTAGGVTITTTELTIAAGVLKYDYADTVYTTVTISNAMAGITFFNVGTAATDQLVLLQDFVTAASATAANFTIQHAAGGVLTITNP